MRREQLYQPYEIEYETLHQYPKAKRRATFFELIYVVAGTGVQHVNQHVFAYRPGNLFLITPQDTNFFDITAPTTFFFLRFNNLYVKARATGVTDWIERLEFILQNASHRPGCILKNPVDKPFVAALVENMMREHANQQLYCLHIIQQVVNTLITIVARNIALKLPALGPENSTEPVLNILQYIQEHICDPAELKTRRISQQLGFSANYLGRYFKKQTGETLQEYILSYKMRLVETRLLNSDMRINEIAHELHFTDESHLNRLFKKHKGVSLSEFRKNSSPRQASTVPGQ